VSEYLVVRLAEESSEATWIALDDSGHRLTQVTKGRLEETASAAENRLTLLLVPGISVITTQATLPVKSQTRLRQMLPYSLEDVVAQDVEQLLFAAGPRAASGRISVAIVARELMEGWLSRCGDAGLAPHAVYAETEGVPDTPGSLTLIVEGERTYGRRGDNPPFVLEELGLGQVLHLLRQEDQDDSGVRHVVIYADDEGHAHCEGELAELRKHLSSVDLQLLPEGPLPRLGATLVNQPATNLLQGPYAPQSNWGELVGPWRFAAALLLGLVVLMTVTEGARYLSLTRQDQALASLLQSSCQQTFQAPRLSACQAEIERRLASTGSSLSSEPQRGLLQALAAIGQAGDAESRIEALSFRDGVMDLRVVAPSVPALDQFVRTVGDGGQFQVNIQSANPRDDGVEGRLQVVGVP